MKNCIIALVTIFSFLFTDIAFSKNTEYPSSSYELSSDGTVLIKWYGNETDIDMNSDPILQNVTHIGEEAFIFNTTLQSIILSAGLLEIGYQAFGFCPNIYDIQMGDELIKIESYAFWKCEKIQVIELPATLNYIGEGVFNACYQLKYINVDQDNTSYASEDGILFNADKNKLLRFPANHSEDYFIPSYVTSIGENAFSYTNTLTNISLPSSIVSIGEYAIAYAKNLTTVQVYMPQALLEPDMGIRVFYGSDVEYATLYVPKGSLSNYMNAPQWNEFGDIFEYDNDMPYELSDDGLTLIKWLGQDTIINMNDYPDMLQVTTIADYAFYENQFAESITLSQNINKIGKRAFASSEKLNAIYLNDNLNIIDEYAFFNCNSPNFNNIALPESLTEIGEGAFMDCIYLGSGQSNTIEIPSSVNIIERRAFTGCYSLKGLCVSPDNDYYSDIDNVLFNKDKTTLHYFPNGYGSSYVIPEGVSQIDEYAFAKALDLVNVTFNSDLKEISDFAFFNCSSLMAVQLSEELNTIGNQAFSWCESLYKVSIPASVTSIGDQVFKKCILLQEVYAYNPMPLVGSQMGNNVFMGCLLEYASLHVPKGFEASYANAPQWKDFGTIVGDILSIDESNENISIITSSGELLLDGINNNTLVKVYKINGNIIYSDIVQSNTIRIPLHRGIYILSIDNIVKKILIP